MARIRGADPSNQGLLSGLFTRIAGCLFELTLVLRSVERVACPQRRSRPYPASEPLLLFSETEKVVLEYADAVTQTPVEVVDSLFAKRREKFGDVQLVELTATLVWENYRARFDHAFGVESEGFTQGSYCALPVHWGSHA
jgi:alkylhydroperoxidase family enzyme